MRYWLALLSGSLMGLGPAPFNTWFLAWIALAPLWLLVSQPKTSWRSVTLQALLWGLGYHGLALSWFFSWHPLTWLGIPWLVSLVIVGSCWLFITLWGTLPVIGWAWGMKLLHAKLIVGSAVPSLWLRVLWGTTLWCSLEYLRSLSFLDWSPLAYTQSPHNLAILHLGQLSGPLTVTAAIAVINGGLAETWLAYQAYAATQPRASDWQWRQVFQVLKPKLMILIGLFIGLHLLGWGLYSCPLVERPAVALQIGIVQGNIPTRIKLQEDGIQQALANYTSGYKTLADQGVDAILTPEGALPILWSVGTPISNSLLTAVRDRRAVLWLGIFVQQEGRITQSLITLDGNGDLFSRYNKVKLVPLGEYIPFEEVLGQVIRRLSSQAGSLSPGRSNQQFMTPLGQAAVGICFDAAFADLFRTQVNAGAQFILTASNLDPYSTPLMTQVHAQEVMRAIESDRWLVRATNTGFSGVIDPHGHTHWLSERNSYVTHAATIYRRETQTLYSQWGNWLTPLLLGWSSCGIAAQAFKAR